MLNFDLIISCLACIQPIIIGFVVIVSLKNSLNDSSFFKNHSSIRSKNNNTVLYECATNSRLNSNIIYDIYTISTCVVFVVYDVDLIFIFAEATNLFTYSFYNIIVFFIFVFLFIVGIILDYRSLGFSWKLGGII